MTHNVARSGARASFPPKHGLTNTTEVTASNSTVLNAVVAHSSTPVSNVGVVTQFPIAPDPTRAKVKPN